MFRPCLEYVIPFAILPNICQLQHSTLNECHSWSGLVWYLFYFLKVWKAYSVIDNLKSRDASASQNLKHTLRHSYNSFSRHNHTQWLVLQSTRGELVPVPTDQTTLISGDIDADFDCDEIAMSWILIWWKARVGDVRPPPPGAWGVTGAGESGIFPENKVFLYSCIFVPLSFWSLSRI